ncbi:DUF1801 domain-containing protein [Flaviaesturariibacter amylovorans]|uniref:YdhG-like domain-containing protein n=1 Tax=Flaviaesturariibacter amylovorans TaxID=1084520 RepID=A0ABP8G5D0_9BACT
MNPEVSRYISEASEAQRPILEAVRRIVHNSVPGVQEDYKWSRPVFRAAQDFAYLKTAKAYVTLGFYDALRLRDPQSRLEGTGKGMRHIKLRTLADVDELLLSEWLRTAAS